MVNWWFEMLGVMLIGLMLSTNPFHTKIPNIQTIILPLVEQTCPSPRKNKAFQVWETLAWLFFFFSWMFQCQRWEADFISANSLLMENLLGRWAQPFFSQKKMEGFLYTFLDGWRVQFAAVIVCNRLVGG